MPAIIAVLLASSFLLFFVSDTKKDLTNNIISANKKDLTNNVNIEDNISAISQTNTAQPENQENGLQEGTKAVQTASKNSSEEPSQLNSSQKECGFYFEEYSICSGTCPEGRCISEGRSCYCKIQ